MKAGFLWLAAVALLITSCVDKDFDAPPAGGTDPGLTPTMTIAEIKALHTLGQYEEITTDEIIRGYVISNDEAGNFYKQLVIQDETAGIEMRIDVTDLFSIYPPGRQVYVRLKGLWLGDFNGLVQLGAAVTGSGNDRELVRIPETISNQILVTGTFGNEVQPKVLTINQLNTSHVSTLVQINDVQFVSPDAGVTYADPVNELSKNLEIEDCAQKRVIVRSSGFSTFAAELTPTGKGTIVGVLGVFGSDLQLLIRDLDDVNMDSVRCGGGGGPMTIQSLRDAYNGGSSSAPEGTITAVVISDRSTNNVNNRNLFIQDESAGIVVRFEDPHSFNLGDELTINVSGYELAPFHDLLQLNNVALSRVTVNGQKPLPEPRTATVNDVLTNIDAWESTRVRISNATLSGGATYADDIVVTDASGAMILFTFFSATFSSSPITQGPVDIVAIISRYDTPQLIINSTGDITGGNVGENMTIQSLRDAYGGGASVAPEGTITGVVISDRTTNNINSRNLYIQDESAGILVRFDNDHSFNLGDKVRIIVTGFELAPFHDLLQVNEVTLTGAVALGQQTLPAPRIATVSEVLANLDSWESIRVRINNATISGGASYGDDNIIIEDGTGSVILYTSSFATFSATPVPQEVVDVTTIVSRYDVAQLIINSTGDVTGGGTGGSDLDESFDAFADNQDIAIQGWLNVATRGTRIWRAKVFDGNHYAQATAFGDTEAEMETWMITSAIDVATPKWLSFTTAQAFWVHDGLSVLSSTDFNGVDIGSATWTPLAATIAAASDTEHEFIPSGDIDLEQFSKPVFIAFRYIGSGPGGQTTSYRVDDVLVREK